jgi:hypothetical protein
MVDLHGDQALSRTRLSSLKFAQPYIWRLIIDAVDVAFDCAGTVRQGQSLATLAGGLLPRCSSGATMPTLRLSGQVSRDTDGRAPQDHVDALAGWLGPARAWH